MGDYIIRRIPVQTWGKPTNALILANGDPPSAELLRRLRAEGDLFIATDGAANGLRAAGIMPDVVLGDFDSLSPAARTGLPESAFVDAWDQEASDLEKAMAYAVSRGATRVTITGASGGRLDHTLTGISILMKYAELDARIVDDLGETRIVRNQAELSGKPGDTLSLIVFAPAHGVQVEGARWPLKNAELLPGSRGVSNELLGHSVRVSVQSGTLVVVHLHGRPGHIPS